MDLTGIEGDKLSLIPSNDLSAGEAQSCQTKQDLSVTSRGSVKVSFSLKCMLIDACAL